MKKTLSVLTILLLVLIAIPPTFASRTPRSPGVKPDSFFYFFDTALEKVNLFFTFSPEKKVTKALLYAEERLAEMEAISHKNEPKAIARAMAGYRASISLATEKSKMVKDEARAENLFTAIIDGTSQHQDILVEIHNRVSEQAKIYIEKAIEVSIKSQEEASKGIQGLKRTVEELQKDIELLKQQGQSDQDKEIEALRKEIEILKSQQSSQPARPQVIERVVEKIIETPPPVLQDPAPELSNSEIIEKVKPAVVFIEVSDGSGSGMIIESDGYVLTNAHVVSGADTARVKLSDSRLFVASVVGRDANIDLALLKIKASNLPAVILGDSSTVALKQGDEVFAFGYPFGLEEEVSFKEGTISRRQTYEGTTYLETSAEIHPGNSGGPLVNRFAQVIGINTAGLGESVNGLLLGETIKFAIPINLARGLIPQLKEGRNVVASKELIPEPIPQPQPTPIPEPTPFPESPVLPRTDTTPPEISNAQVSNIGVDSVTITWSTDEPSISQVEYGVTANYGNITRSPLGDLIVSYVFNHTEKLKNLNVSTTYHFRVISMDSDGNEAKSLDYTFTTKE